MKYAYSAYELFIQSLLQLNGELIFDSQCCSMKDDPVHIEYDASTQQDVEFPLLAQNIIFVVNLKCTSLKVFSID